jgi:hypothetical protein
MFLGFPIPIRKNSWKCYNCGAEWTDQENEGNSSFSSLPNLPR